MSDKPKFPRAAALKVARFLCLKLADHCTRLICAGSLRRRKEQAGDIELVYIPDFRAEPDGLFDTRQVNLADEVIGGLLKAGVLAKRKTVMGSEVWGEKNKLAVHVASGIPVDLFETREASWFNYLVCRTGGAENNTRIASAAQAKGWKWNPYGAGFTDERGRLVCVTSEREVFEFVGLKYLEPWERQ